MDVTKTYVTIFVVAILTISVCNYNILATQGMFLLFNLQRLLIYRILI